jgi:uncharacterized damage-inducible protein DinB
MLPILEAYVDRLEMLHADIRRTLESLSPETLDWMPGVETNSLAMLAAHVSGSERYWVGEVAGGDPANRDRPAEFRTQGLDATALTARLEAALTHSRAILERLTLADLEARRLAGDRGEVSVAWALFHNLQHVATHLGQMQLTRQLWEQREK